MSNNSRFQFLGVGYDTLAGEKREKLVRPLEVAESEATTSFTMTTCETDSEIFSSLDVKASLGLSYKGFDLDAKMTYATELSTKRNSVTVLAIARKSIKGEINRSEMLEHHTSITKMFQRGGDSYINEVVEGGMYVASYQFESLDEEQKRKITADCKAKFRGMAEASASVDINEIAKKHNVTWTFMQKTFGGKAMAGSKDDVFKTGQAFINADMTAPTMLRFVTKSYSRLKDCPDEFANIDKYMKAYTSKYYDYGNSLAAIERQANIARAKTRAVKQLYEFYQVSGPLVGINEHLGRIDKLQRALKTFKDSFDPVKVPDPQQVKPQLDLESLKVPTVNIEIVAGPWSGFNTDDKWLKTVDKNMIDNFIYPKRISAHGGGVLQRIKVEYARGRPSSSADEATTTQQPLVVYNGGWEDFGMRELDDVADIGPGEVTKIGVWINDSQSVPAYMSKPSGVFLDRKRDDQLTSFMIRGPEGATGHGSQAVEKQPDTSFMGFEGCNSWTVNRLMAAKVIAGLRPVFAKFSHSMQPANMPDEYYQ